MERVARIEHFARAGYLARAIVYFLIGYIALRTGQSEGTQSVLDNIRALPLGTVLLVLTGVGLFGYGVFRLYGAALDIQNDGTDAKGIGKRIGHAGSGVAHLVLSYLALRLAFGGSEGGGGGSDTSAGEMAHSLPGGAILLAAVGAGFALAAVEQAVKAGTGKFMRLLDANAPGWTEALGRIGYAARAVVFAALAWKILAAALSGDAEQLSFQAALAMLHETGWLYSVVAFGLLVFGLFSLVMARYRKIRDQHLIDRLSG